MFYRWLQLVAIFLCLFLKKDFILAKTFYSDVWRVLVLDTPAGLLGNANGNAGDDLQTPNHDLLPSNATARQLYEEFGMTCKVFFLNLLLLLLLDEMVEPILLIMQWRCWIYLCNSYRKMWSHPWFIVMTNCAVIYCFLSNVFILFRWYSIIDYAVQR